jgi:hypothetical protein
MNASGDVFVGCAQGVAHPAKDAFCVRLLPVIPGVIVPARSPSVADGVVHPANCTTCSFSGRLFRSIVSGLARPSRQSRALGVAQDDSAETAVRSGPRERIASRIPPSVERTPLSASAAVGVGHEEQSLPDVRSGDALKAGIILSLGVVRVFHWCLNRIDAVSWLIRFFRADVNRPWSVSSICHSLLLRCQPSKIVNSASSPQFPSAQFIA